MKYLEYLEKLIEKIKKYGKSPYLFIIPLCICVSMHFETKSNIKQIILNGNTIDVDLRLFLYIAIFVIFIVILLFNKSKLKNKTDKLGIGLFIDNSDTNDNNFRRNRFISELKNELEDYYEVKIYTKEDYKKYLKGILLDEKIFTDYNLSCSILIDDTSDTKNDESYYFIKKKNIQFYFVSPYAENKREISLKMQSELIKLFPDIYEIRASDGMNDTKRVVKELHLAIDYITCVNISLSLNPYNTMEYINSLSYNLNEYIQQFGSNNITKFISIRIQLREIDYRLNDIEQFITYKQNRSVYKDNYYLLTKINRVEKLFNASILENPYYFSYFNELMNYKILTFFDLKKYDDILKLIKRLNYDENSSFIFITKFVSMCGSKKYSNKDAIAYFNQNKKILNNEKDIEDLIEFIQVRYENNKDDIILKFSYYMLNKYFKDQSLAERLKKELQKQTEYFNDVL
ncbi:MAG: hypothetical protein J1F35_00465 [Erysipelotrichales bacterium]|nr:hypothetical protein [Erysipelotrichales bacterium]